MTVAELQAAEDFRRTFVTGLDLCGTFVFALSGGLAGVQRRLDVFGVLVLSFVASSFGGIGRDVLIGAIPPAALVDWRYLTISLMAGLIAFVWPASVVKYRRPIQLLDAMGLAFFAVAGAEKALTFHLSPVIAALLGMLTGVGGGVARDMLLSEIPAVLRSDLYAVAALVTSSIVVAGSASHLPVLVTATCAGLVGFGLRIMAILFKWHLPIAGGGEKHLPDNP
jgi:uncharacterized membrane protein YeiH